MYALYTCKHWWFSGRILSYHAGGPGSIPGQCTPTQRQTVCLFVNFVVHVVQINFVVRLAEFQLVFVNQQQPQIKEKRTTNTKKVCR